MNSILIFFQTTMLKSMLFFQGSLIKPNDPDERDFLSKNPDLIWGILIGIFVLAMVVYLVLRKKAKSEKDKEEET